MGQSAPARQVVILYLILVLLPLLLTLLLLLPLFTLEAAILSYYKQPRQLSLTLLTQHLILELELYWIVAAKGRILQTRLRRG